MNTHRTRYYQVFCGIGILLFSMSIAQAQTTDDEDILLPPETPTIPLPAEDIEDDSLGDWGGIFSVPVTKLVEPAFVKRQLQVNYVLQMAQQVLYLLNYYEDSFSMQAPSDVVNAWQNSLLADDPFIANIGYVERSFVSIVLRDSVPVIPDLQGLEIRYNYREQTWVPAWSLQTLLGLSDAIEVGTSASDSALVSEGSISIAINPTPIDVFHSMGVITDYCLAPAGYVYPANGMLPDTQWCPAWHAVVMPPY